MPDECIRDKNLLYHIAQPDGRLVEYRTVLIKERENIVKVSKSSYRNIEGWVLRVFYDSYIAEYHSDKDNFEPFPKEQYSQRIYWRSTEIHTATIDQPRVCGVNARYNFAPYFSLGFPVPTGGKMSTNMGDIVKGGSSVSFVFTIFTTRADTMFGVTFMVLAPESDLVAELTTADQKA